MTEVTLRPITQDNWYAVVKLKVAESQRTFVADNARSLAEACYEGGEVRAIYAGDTPVGFTYYVLVPEEHHAYLVRLMIDAAQQGKGYGRAALRQILDVLRAEPVLETVLLGVEAGNAVAIRLYESFGFADTGRVEQGEKVFALALC